MRASPSLGAPPFMVPPSGSESPRSRALGHEGRPQPAAWTSSRCRRAQRISHRIPGARTDTHLPPEPGLQRPPGLPRPEPPGAFVPADSGIGWDPGRGRLGVRQTPLRSSSTLSEWPRTVPTSPRVPWTGTERKEAYSAAAPIRRRARISSPRAEAQTGAARARTPPTQSGSPGIHCQADSTPYAAGREVPPTDPPSVPTAGIPAQHTPQPGARWLKSSLSSRPPSFPRLPPAARCPPPCAAHRRLPQLPGLRRFPPPAPLKTALPSTAQPPQAFFSEPSGTAQSPIPVFRGGEKRSEAAWQPSSLGA